MLNQVQAHISFIRSKCYITYNSGKINPIGDIGGMGKVIDYMCCSFNLNLGNKPFERQLIRVGASPWHG